MAKANGALFFEVSALRGDNMNEFLTEFTTSTAPNNSEMIENRKRIESQNRSEL